MALSQKEVQASSGGVLRAIRTLQALSNFDKKPAFEIPPLAPAPADASGERQSVQGLSYQWPNDVDRLFDLRCPLRFLTPPFDGGTTLDTRNGSNPFISRSPTGQIVGYSQYLLQSGQMAQVLVVDSDFQGGPGIPGLSQREWSSAWNLTWIFKECAALIREAAPPAFQRLKITADVQVTGTSQITSRPGLSLKGFAFTGLTLILESNRILDRNFLSRLEGIPHAFAPTGYNLGTQSISETFRLTATIPAKEARTMNHVGIVAMATAGVVKGSALKASINLDSYDMIEQQFKPGITVTRIALDFCP